MGNKIITAEEAEEKARQQEEERKNEENRLCERMKYLETFSQDGNNTLKKLKEAQKEFTEIQDKLNIRNRTIYFKV